MLIAPRTYINNFSIKLKRLVEFGDLELQERFGEELFNHTIYHLGIYKIIFFFIYKTSMNFKQYV